MATDIQISIVGSAGDGTIAAGEILRGALAGMGYKVISFDVYPPEIRGFGKCIARGHRVCSGVGANHHSFHAVFCGQKLPARWRSFSRASHNVALGKARPAAA